MSLAIRTACGQRRCAIASCCPEPTPNRRASYEAAITTPRALGSGPVATITGLPVRSGRWRRSTATKNASMSTCAIQRRKLKEVFQPNDDAVDPAHRANRHDHAGHERFPRERVVPDRERLADTTEDDLLMCHEAWKPHAVDRLVGAAACLADELCSALRRAGRRIELLLVMQLDDLAFGHV